MESNRDSRAPKRVWLAVGASVVILITVGFLVHGFVAARELSTYFDQLKPGMTYTEVTQLIPQGMIHSSKEPCTSVVWRTFLVRTNALPSYQVYCSGPAEPLPGAEAGRIYFDKQDHLIGVNYSASGAGAGGFWKPNWGVRYE